MKRSYPRMTTARPGDCPGTGHTFPANPSRPRRPVICPVCWAVVSLSRQRVVRHVPPDDPEARERVRLKLEHLRSPD